MVDLKPFGAGEGAGECAGVDLEGGTDAVVVGLMADIAARKARLRRLYQLQRWVEELMRAAGDVRRRQWRRQQRRQ